MTDILLFVIAVVIVWIVLFKDFFIRIFRYMFFEKI